MSGFRLVIVSAFCLWLAGGCQEALASRIGILSARPDFLLIAISTIGLLTSRRSSMCVGFIGGLIQGAVAGANLAAYIVSRTLVGFLVGWLSGFEFESNVIVAAIVTIGSTIFAGLLTIFVAPSHAPLTLLLATIGSAMYNGVLAIPVYAFIAKLSNAPRH